MRSFNRKRHGSIVLDDVRDLEFLSDHQHVLQSRYDDDDITFASTNGGTVEYTKYLYRVPFIITVNPSTKNLDFLDNHPWLGVAENRVLLELKEQAWEPVAPAALV